MNLPKIIFRNSWLYDKALIRGKKFKQPDKSAFEKYIKNLEKQWKIHGKKIMTEMSKVTGLKWHEKEIVCYLSYGVRAYSDPLTLNFISDIHTLTHELIHRIISEPENWLKIRKNWVKLLNNYSNEKPLTRTHIVVHAIHKHIYLKLFSQKILSKDVKKSEKFPAYKKAWGIVEEDGYENIIKALKKGTK